MKLNMDRKFRDPFIKERRKDWLQETEGRENDPRRTLNFVGDRFIPKRFRRENIEYNLKYVGKTEEKDILKTSLPSICTYWRQNSFVSAINQTFNIREHRLLDFGFTGNERSGHRLSGDWPCRPRLKPCAFQDATHDMPDFNSGFDYNLMDWSTSDQIAVSFGMNVVIWRNKDDSTMIFGVKRPKSLKYSPNGKYLAIGCMECDYPIVELWELQPSKEFFVAEGKYFHKYVKAVCCIEWTRDSTEILCGTSNGDIYVLPVPAMRTRLLIQKHKHPIRIMRFSPSMRYLATGDSIGNIYVFDGRTYQVIMHMGSRHRHGVVFDWHPWTGVDLAISEKVPASIIILNMPRAEIVASYQRRDKKIMISSVNFSNVTGELLVSISRRDDDGCPYCEIIVLSSLNHVVDIIENKDRGAIFMMWSPDGKRLATAALDESFSIWNFYPQYEYNGHEKNERHSSADEDARDPLALFGFIK
ncbi:protein cortex isoform X2 [Scaptodrosophila lebanonensis]|uniref:Protein cortex isoform X2 n=1 Tax=Drosophila lebanonensis TaxID=7225 RepID=A0A6J2TPF6_DROLE|nr:protein cortex isoform X2 [Scaptodrosophila lebanonensis]